MPSKRNATFPSLRHFWRLLQGQNFCFTGMPSYCYLWLQLEPQFFTPKRSRGCWNILYYLGWKSKTTGEIKYAVRTHAYTPRRQHPLEDVVASAVRRALEEEYAGNAECRKLPGCECNDLPRTLSLAFHTQFPSLRNYVFPSNDWAFWKLPLWNTIHHVGELKASRKNGFRSVSTLIFWNGVIY